MGFSQPILKAHRLGTGVSFLEASQARLSWVQQVPSQGRGEGSLSPFHLSLSGMSSLFPAPTYCVLFLTRKPP